MSLPQRLRVNPEFLQNTWEIDILIEIKKMHILECKIYKGLIYVFYAGLKPLIAVTK